MPIIMKKNAQAGRGTCLQGYLHTDRKTLRAIFGNCNVAGDGDRCQYEWGLSIGGTLVTIYDFKEPRGVKATDSIQWHIGGASPAAVLMLKEYLHQQRHWALSNNVRAA